MLENTVDFSFRARYYQSGAISDQTRQVWFVLHGYGQLAQYFIRKFRILADHGICIVAPEGLSRFYLDELQTSGRKSNRVGATWMTRENREMDIRNYLRYLNEVYTAVMNNAKIPVTVLGFSQGSATASRWALDGNIAFERLILWAGIFPPDMDFANAPQRLHSKAISLVYGIKDPFLTDARFQEMSTLTKKLNAEVKEVTFDGGHDIDEKTLLKFV